MLNYGEDDKDSSRKLREKFVIIEPPKGPIDPSSVPTTPMEYLQHVWLERKECPTLMRSQIDPEQFRSNQSVMKVESKSVKTKLPNNLAPSASWKRDKITKFLKVRMELLPQKDELRERFKDDQKFLPGISNSLDWCAFCLGLEQVTNLRNKGEKRELSKRYEKSDGHPPLLRFVIHLSTSQIIKLLEYHTQWLRQLGFSHHQGRWIFALLTCLEEPLFPDSIFILREIVRVCSGIREVLKDKHDTIFIALNHIISVITVYFKQKDMEDPDGPETDE